MHFSPQVALLEACTGVLLGVFFAYHSWKYDRWNCFKIWRLASEAPRDPWKLKRLLTVLFLIRVPAFSFKAVAVAKIKYQVGFTPVESEGRGMPVPCTMWTPAQAAWIQPMNWVDSVIWWSDLVMALEELMFWFFLIHDGPKSERWFKSTWFKILIGAALGYAGMFAGLTAAYIDDPLALEARIFMAFSSLGLFQTMGFIYVLYAFPKIIHKLIYVGGSPDLIHRLLVYHDLNRVQTFLRLMFSGSLFITSLDGLGAFDSVSSTPNPINTNLPVLDTLLFLAILGCTGATGITALVFLPRSSLEEHGVRDRRVANPHGGAILLPPDHKRHASTSSATVVGDGESEFHWESEKKASLRKRTPPTIEEDELPEAPVPAYTIPPPPVAATGGNRSPRHSLASDYAPSLPDLPPEGQLSRLNWSKTSRSFDSAHRVEAMPDAPLSPENASWPSFMPDNLATSGRPQVGQQTQIAEYQRRLSESETSTAGSLVPPKPGGPRAPAQIPPWAVEMSAQDERSPPVYLGGHGDVEAGVAESLPVGVALGGGENVEAGRWQRR